MEIYYIPEDEPNVQFMSYLLISSVFFKLKDKFTFEDFKQAFFQVFLPKYHSEEDCSEAFELALGSEMISVSDEVDYYIFTGIPQFNTYSDEPKDKN